MNQELKRIVRKAITEHLIFHKHVDSKEDRIDLICEQVAEEFYQAWDDARVDDVCKKGGLDLKKMGDKLNRALSNDSNFKGWFSDEVQNSFIADFGFDTPHETKSECHNPVFKNKHLHRIAIMKDYHVGAKGDIEENGASGWISKYVCTGCGKTFTKNGLKGGFYKDK